MAKKSDFSPFKNESDSIQIGDDLTIENRTDRVSIYGSIDITLDKKGLADAKKLKNIIDATIQEMTAANLPEKVSIKTAESVDNPFT
jgi:lantibiotic modifying enzyme